MKHKHNHSEENAPNPEMADPVNEQQETAQTAESTPQPDQNETITALNKEITDLKEKLIYLQADYQNYRKRTSKDIADARNYGQASALEPFLTIYDFLGMAKVASEKSDNIDSIRQGLDMIMTQFLKTFDDVGIKRLETVGAVFNPDLHEAVANEHSDSVPEGNIIKEWTGGYKLGERLLRPARVVVSAGPQPANEENNDTDSATKE